MKNWLRLFPFYFKRTLKDSFTIGYSIIFPLIMIGLIGVLLKNSYSGDLSSFTYYTIALIPFCIGCELTTAAYLGQEEARKKVAERFLISPLSIHAILIAKWSAGVTALSICHGFVYLIAHFVFGVSYQGYGFLIFLLSIGFTGLIYGLGLWIGLGMKNFIVIKNVVTIPIIAFAILGGCFYPIGSDNEMIQVLIQLSPNTWMNRAAFLAMYDSSVKLLVSLCILLLVLGAGSVLLAIHRFRKEDFCNGDMFSYEK